MKKRLLTVGVPLPSKLGIDVQMENLGLCSAEANRERSASALYEYDAIVINPESFSHFLFGEEGPYSRLPTELSELKKSNNQYDYDTVFDQDDRTREMDVALRQGCLVVWCMAVQRRQNFFGYRNTSDSYLNSTVIHVAKRTKMITKHGRAVIESSARHPFSAYFQQIRSDGWRLAISGSLPAYRSVAETPEGYSVGGKVELGDANGWLLTPPTSLAAKEQLLLDILKSLASSQDLPQRSSLFLSHTHADKPFANRLRSDLLSKGVGHVWIDEAEILVGDSLLTKIEQGLRMSKFIGIILSPRSIDAPWVRRELEIAMERELADGRVVVLPILHEHCEVPSCLRGKLYADFTDLCQYQVMLDKLLKRLKSD